MPKQSGPNPYRGKKGKTVGYLLNDVHYERSLPEEVHQNENTQNASARFGLASRMGRLIRQTMQQELDFSPWADLTNRLNTKLIKGINDNDGKDMLLELKEFQFNAYTPVRNLLPKDLLIEINGTGDLCLQVPELKCRHLRKDTHVELKAIVIHINSREIRVKRVASESRNFEIKAFKGADFTFPAAAENETNLVVLQCRFFNDLKGFCNYTYNRKFYGADIIAVLPTVPGLYRVEPS